MKEFFNTHSTPTAIGTIKTVISGGAARGPSSSNLRNLAPLPESSAIGLPAVLAASVQRHSIARKMNLSWVIVCASEKRYFSSHRRDGVLRRVPIRMAQRQDRSLGRSHCPCVGSFCPIWRRRPEGRGGELLS